VDEATITRAAGRVLYEIVKFGYMDGMQRHSVTPQEVEANAKIIEKTGEDAAVLLKNEDHVLPLKAADLDSVVLIGPTAGQVDSIGINGERSVGLPWREVGPLAAMKKIAGNSRIQFAVADDMNGTTVPASALSHDGKPGLLQTGGGAAETDGELNFTKKKGNALAPNSKLVWKGTLTPPHAGNYWIYLQRWARTRAFLWMARSWRRRAHARVAYTGTFCRRTRTTWCRRPMVWITCAARWS
jgi:beta-glucosidase